MWQREASDLRQAFQGLQVMSTLAFYESGLNVGEQLRIGGLDGASYVQFENAPHRPRFIAAGNDAEAVVFMGGYYPSHGVDYVASALGYDPQAATLGIVGDLVTGILDVVNKIGSTYLQRPRLTFYGHSGGGAVMSALAMFLVRRNLKPANAVQCITFGSPKTVSFPYSDSMENVNIVRFFADDDVVPYIIPDCVQAPRMHVALTDAGSRRANLLRHVGVGVELPQSGNWFLSDYPPEDLIPAEYNIAAWLTENLRGANSTHSLYHYQSRLSAAISNMVHNPDTRSSRIISDSTAPLASGRNTPAVNQARQALVMNETARAGQVKTVGKDLLWSYVKEGDGYKILWGQTEVGFTFKKGDASKIVRHGNFQVRRWQRVGNISYTGYTAALDSFLRTGSATGGATLPPMNVTGITPLPPG